MAGPAVGVLQDGKKIAVKMLYDMPGLDDEQFKNEFKNLTWLRHQNIVRLVGYCYDIQEIQVMHEGRLILAERTHRALCLEYMSKGSLENYLSDECDRYDWHTGYGIINGICKGLKYLHNELEPPIYHLDLKPANVLLDENMVPRIADFGMSRLFTDEQTRATRSSLGTFGYLPPEYIHNNLISNKFDIFSLGVVIIKIMAGRAGYFNSAEMPSREFTDLVQEKWTTKLLETFNLRKAYSAQKHEADVYGVDSLGHLTQPGNISNLHCEQETPSKNNPSPSYDMEADKNIFPRKDSRSSIDMGNTFNVGNSLPGVEGFQISGDPKPGSTLRACGFSINGTTVCHIQWVHYLKDGTRHSIEGATTSDYVVTADDVDTLLAVDCTPMDDNGRQGNLVMEFANNANKITCARAGWRGQEEERSFMYREADGGSWRHGIAEVRRWALLEMDSRRRRKLSGVMVALKAERPGKNYPSSILCYADPELQNDVNICISRGRADFDVFVLMYSPEEWEHATLVLRRTGYQVNLSRKDEILIDEKYSPNVQIKIPIGRTTQFILVSSRGVNLPFNTQGITEPSTEDNDIRLRDLTVLVFRAFQNKKCKGDDVDDDSTGKKKDDEMDTSEHASNPFSLPPSSSAPTNDVHITQVQWHGLAGIDSASALGGGSMTPRCIQLAADLRANSMLRGCLERSLVRQRQGTLSSPAPLDTHTTQPSAPMEMAVSHATGGGDLAGGMARLLISVNDHLQLLLISGSCT
uniref:non-specific serine/threonine protein kinase n=1 Tax=Aegilops tauschii TaxID=37682 RepID=R7WDX1_AEGTA